MYRMVCNGQSIGSTVDDAIVRSRLLSTRTGSSKFSTILDLLQVIDNSPHEQWYKILRWRAPGHRRLYIMAFVFIVSL